MKILKFNEDLNKIEPKIGDYVILNYGSPNAIRDYIKINPGKIIEINFDKYGEILTIIVQYYNVPNIIRAYFRYISDDNIMSKIFLADQIIEFGSTLEELELKINAGKFNI